MNLNNQQLLFILGFICLYDGILGLDLVFLYAGLVILISNVVYMIQEKDYLS